jgi:3-methyladenine DNA glycosylase AlkC
MQNFLTLGKNFENNKKDFKEDEERQIFLKNIQLSLTHLRSLNCPTQKNLIKNKISKLLLSNKKEINDPYFIYLRNIYEIQKKVENQLNDDSNINSLFSNKIYNYFQSENNFKEVDIKIKK